MNIDVNANISPKAKIIEGFPGFGLIGIITTEFLIDHLKAEQVGTFFYDEVPAHVSIHKGVMIDPMGVYYCKKHNLVIMHTLLSSKDLEWEITQAILSFAEDINAEEIISLEGVSSPDIKDSKNVFFYTNDNKRAKILSKLKVPPIKESVIVGVSGALMLRSKYHCYVYLVNLKQTTRTVKALQTL